MARVELHHVFKRYGPVEAVKDLNLACDEGELLALLGPSGCGKTSTLRMVAGLEEITAGEGRLKARLHGFRRADTAQISAPSAQKEVDRVGRRG